MSMPAPTTEELMMLVDGELEPSRAAEVEEFLTRNEEARAIVAGLTLVGNVIAEDALDAASRRGDVVDEVMRRIDAEPRGGVVRRLTLGTRAMAAMGMVLAAAAALALWVRGRPMGSGDVGPRGEDVSSETAEVDEVDFGARAGTIFYVPSGGKSTTTVVWLMDDEESTGSGEKL